MVFVVLLTVNSAVFVTSIIFIGGLYKVLIKSMFTFLNSCKIYTVEISNWDLCPFCLHPAALINNFQRASIYLLPWIITYSTKVVTEIGVDGYLMQKVWIVTSYFYSSRAWFVMRGTIINGYILFLFTWIGPEYIQMKELSKRKN